MMKIENVAAVVELLKNHGVTDLNLNIPFKAKELAKAKELEEKLRAAGMSPYLEKDGHYYELYLC